jgi:hypothetical protein
MIHASGRCWRLHRPEREATPRRACARGWPVHGLAHNCEHQPRTDICTHPRMPAAFHGRPPPHDLCWTRTVIDWSSSSSSTSSSFSLYFLLVAAARARTRVRRVACFEECAHPIELRPRGRLLRENVNAHPRHLRCHLRLRHSRLRPCCSRLQVRDCSVNLRAHAGVLQKACESGPERALHAMDPRPDLAEHAREIVARRRPCHLNESRRDGGTPCAPSPSRCCVRVPPWTRSQLRRAHM